MRKLDPAIVIKKNGVPLKTDVKQTNGIPA